MRRQVFNTLDCAHFLTFSTYQRVPVFGDDRFCLRFLDVLDRERQRQDFEVWAYVLMPDHVHVLIWPREAYDISSILRAIKQPVASTVLSTLRRDNNSMLHGLLHRSSRKYRLWQAGGGFDRNLRTNDMTMNAMAYIHQNPVSAGLAEIPEQYRWSSAGWYAGFADTPFRVDPNRY